MAYSDNVVSAESGGDPNSQSETSSAAGPGGFIDSTWLSTLRQHRPDLVQGQSDGSLLGLKTDPVLAKQMVDAYAADNQAILSKNGLPVTPGTTYLAHFAGPGGAVKVLQADPTASVSDLLGPAVIKANPFLSGMTAQGLQAWAAKKMGASMPQPGAQPQPAPGTMPLNLAPPRPPIFAQQPQQQQAKPQQAASGDPSQMPAMQAAPIFASPQKQVDIRKLMAAFPAPIFNKRQG